MINSTGELPQFIIVPVIDRELKDRFLWLYSDFPTDEYAKYQAGYAFYPDFKCAEFCQFLYNISVCKGFIMKPAEKSTCAPTSSMVAHSRAG